MLLLFKIFLDVQFGVGVYQYPGADAEGFVHQTKNQLLVKTLLEHIRKKGAVDVVHTSRWLFDDAVDAPFAVINQIVSQCCVFYKINICD